MQIQTLVSLVKQTFSDWSDDKAPRLGAALAYYAIFSIPPLLLLVITTVGFFYRGDVAGAIEQQLRGLVGGETARTVLELQQSPGESHGLLATVFGGALLLFGASGVFGELHVAQQ